MTTELQADHLLPKARQALGWTEEEKISAIRMDSFVMYGSAQKVLNIMQSLISKPKTIRPIGLLLTADSGNGKTSILQEFCRSHPRGRTEDYEVYSVISVETPPTAGEKRLLGAMLQSLGLQRWYTGDTDTRLAAVQQMLEQCDVKMIIVDEIHNMLVGEKFLRESLNVIKHLSNRLGLPMVLAGTRRAEEVFQYDPQLSSRFRRVALPLWSDGREYRQFLAQLESTLPLPDRSVLYEKEKAKLLLRLSGGVLGDIVTLTKEAAIISIKNKSKNITVEAIRSAYSMNGWFAVRPDLGQG